MIEPAPLCSQKRRTQDLAELETVATMYIELQLPMDATACENFERLVDMAGTREFIPAICRIRQHLLNLKWSREGIYGLGYIVPIKHLHMSVSSESSLASSNRKTDSPAENKKAIYDHQHTQQHQHHHKLTSEESSSTTIEEFRKLQMLSKIKNEKDMIRRILPGVDMNLDLLGGDMIARAHSEYL